MVIEKHTTALIQTNESIYVSNKICGTYHSKVSLCIKGLSHIGTTLDPCYFGTSLIAVHNNSEEDIKINVGDTFVSLMFYVLRTKSKCLHNNLPFRTDLQDLKIESFNKDYLNKQECKGSECSFYEECKGSNVCGKKIEDKYISIKSDIMNEMKKWINEEWKSNLDELKKVVKNEKLKMNEQGNIKILETIINILLIISIIGLIGYIWIGNFAINSTQYKIIISLAGFVSVILKGLETIIKNLLRGE
nr:hypothetical protein [Clostridium botulinum]